MKFLFVIFCCFSCLVGRANANPLVFREMMEHSGAGRHEEAVKSAEKLVESETKSGGDPAQNGDILVQSGRVFLAAGDAKRAMEVGQIAMKLAKSRGEDSYHAIGSAWAVIAQCHLELDEGLEAESTARILGQVTDQGVPNLIPRCHSLLRIGGSFEEKGDFLLAEKYYRLSANDADMMTAPPSFGPAVTIGRLSAAGRAYSSIAGFYGGIGDHERAI